MKQVIQILEELGKVKMLVETIEKRLHANGEKRELPEAEMKCVTEMNTQLTALRDAYIREIGQKVSELEKVFGVSNARAAQIPDTQKKAA